jgi:hypothetical protein
MNTRSKGIASAKRNYEKMIDLGEKLRIAVQQKVKLVINLV